MIKTERLKSFDFYKLLKESNLELDFFRHPIKGLKLSKFALVTYIEHDFRDKIIREYCTIEFTYFKLGFLEIETKFNLKIEPHTYGKPKILIIQSYILNKSKFHEKSKFLLIYHQLIGHVDFKLANEIDFTNDIVKLLSPKKWFEQKFDQVFENQRGLILGRLARGVYFQMPEARLIEFLMNYQLSIISGFKHWSRRHSYSLSFRLFIERNNLKVRVKYGYYMGDNARSGDGEIVIKLEEYYKSQTMNDSKE